MKEEFKKLSTQELYNHTMHDHLAGEDVRLIAEKGNLHPVLKEARPIHVIKTSRTNAYNETKTYFNLYFDGMHIGNPIILNYEIMEDLFAPNVHSQKIGEMMIKEFIAHCDLEDLDRELAGKCACTEYENIYKCCDECPECRFHKDGNGLTEGTDGCLGATYHFPHHLNGWDIEKEINSTYGPGTANYKKYLDKRVSNIMYQIRWIVDEDASLKKALVRQIKKL